MVQDKDDEEAWKKEQEEEEAERKRKEEEEKERERIERDKLLEMFTNEIIIEGIKAMEEKVKEARNIQSQRQEDSIRHTMMNTQSTAAIQDQQQQENSEEEMESASDSSIPCNQQAYANATKQNNLTEKERKKREKLRKRRKRTEESGRN